jgi:hypothetical protein
MKSLLKALFGGTASAAAPAKTIPEPARPARPAPTPKRGRADYVQATIAHCTHLTPSIHEAVLTHQLAVLEVTDNAAQLPLKELRAKVKTLDETFAASLAEHLTDSGRALARPAAVLEQIRTSAIIRQSRGDKLAQMRGNPVIKKLTLMCSNGGDECAWCRANDGVEYEKLTDLEALIDANCSCTPHCRCVVQPVLDL